jgi:hypothetical protein
MGDNNFSEEDYTKVAEFLNFVASKAEFNGWKTEDTVSHFKLLAHMQQQILPKIKDHILEITKIVEPETEELK